MQLVFWVQDSYGAIVGEKKQVEIELSEKELQAADDRDREAKTKADALIGDCFANRVNYGRSKVVRETCEAIGTIIGKYLDRVVSPLYGCTHIEALDASYPKQKEGVNTCSM